VIAGQVLALASFLAVMWGIYFVASVREYATTRTGPERQTRTRRQEVVRAFRKVVVSLCLFLLPLSVCARATSVVLGFDESTTAAVLYFALAAPNVIGSVYAVVSLRYD
jgi:TRAP-type C4-dicarboxylate transport system permease large subunit